MGSPPRLRIWVRAGGGLDSDRVLNKGDRVVFSGEAVCTGVKLKEPEDGRPERRQHIEVMELEILEIRSKEDA